MAIQVYTNVRAYAAGGDLTGRTNKAAIDAKRDAKETTTFGSGGAKEFTGGLQNGAVSLEGQMEFTDATSTGYISWQNLGSDIPVTIVPGGTVTEALTSLAFLGQLQPDTTKFEGEINEVAPYQLAGPLDGPLVMGSVISNPATVRGSSSSTTAIQLGAVAAGQRMWCALHVLSVAGTATPTFTAKLQSASTSGGSYTDRITFTGATAVGGQFGSVAGAVTDTWWKLTYTITGTGPSFLVAASAGIAAR